MDLESCGVCGRDTGRTLRLVGKVQMGNTVSTMIWFDCLFMSNPPSMQIFNFFASPRSDFIPTLTLIAWLGTFIPLLTRHLPLLAADSLSFLHFTGTSLRTPFSLAPSPSPALCPSIRVYPSFFSRPSLSVSLALSLPPHNLTHLCHGNSPFMFLSLDTFS